MTRRFDICVISGSRADYGLLVSPMKALQAAGFGLTLILTGQHFVASAGDTVARARDDGFDILPIDMGLRDDDPASLVHACARLLDGLAGALDRIKPDLLLVLGDRYEILTAATAATLAGIPIAHIAGGDVTVGAFDEGFRHAITKLSHVHFVTNQEAAQRVRQLGESNVHVVGSPGLDLIHAVAMPDRAALAAEVGLTLAGRTFLVTFHPATLSGNSVAQLEELLSALNLFPDAEILFTGSNADPEGRRIDTRVQAYVAGRAGCRFVPSLGSARYFAALAQMDVVIGNSSSGLYEAPSFGIPTVNIGDRQQGRLKAPSVFDAPPRRDDIAAAIHAALARGRKEAVNPYGDGKASARIVAVLERIADPKSLLQKKFTDIA